VRSESSVRWISSSCSKARSSSCSFWNCCSSCSGSGRSLAKVQRSSASIAATTGERFEVAAGRDAGVLHQVYRGSPRNAGAYPPAGDSPPVYRHVPAPTSAQLQVLVQRIAERTGELLEKRGLVERDMENAWLTVDEPCGHPASVRSSNDGAVT
jgi:hypothetical protein